MSKQLHNLLLGSMLLFSSPLVGGTYIIPPEWDNVKNGVESTQDVLITNITGFYSDNSYTLGKNTLKLKCMSVQKIRCGNGYSPKISIVSSSISLRDSVQQELVSNYGTVIKTEDKGNTWSVCGGALGAVVWDKSEIVDGNYTYTPDSEQLAYYMFTDISGDAITAEGINGGSAKGADSSFLAIKTSQVCR